jgi:hypothetical protein
VAPVASETAWAAASLRMSEKSPAVEPELRDVEKVDDLPQIAYVHAGGDTGRAQSLDCGEGGSMIGWLKRRVRNWLYWTIRAAIADEMAAQFEFDAGTTDRHIVRRAIAETAEFLRASGMRFEQSQPNRVALMKACLGHVMPTGMILEFGVYRGASTIRLGEHFVGGAVYGFDSFEGLREPWVFGEAGQFADAAGHHCRDLLRSIRENDITRNRAHVTELGGRFRQVRRDLYGDHNIDALAKELSLPAHAWVEYERGEPIPGRVFLHFIDATGANPHWLLSGRGERYVQGRAEVPILRNVRHLG